MTAPTLTQARAAFARLTGPLAEQALLRSKPASPARGRSQRFVWHDGDDALGVIVGPQEGSHVDSALGLSLAARGDRRLILMLPEELSAATVQRWGWLRDEVPLEVWTHEGGVATKLTRPERTAPAAPRQPAPAVLSAKLTSWVEELLLWAGERRDLDAAHHGVSRGWEVRGVPVLTVTRDSAAHLTVTAGLDGPAQVVETIRGPLDPAQRRRLQDGVRGGVQARLTTGTGPDEVWLRAALRRHPRSLGLEEPALRSVPVQRPGQGGVALDVMAPDATGRLVLVEAALGADDDVVLLGLDDYAYAQAHLEAMADHWRVRPDTEIEIAFCFAAKAGSVPTLTRHSRAQLEALAPDVRWHLRAVSGWSEGTPMSRRYPTGIIPDQLA